MKVIFAHFLSCNIGDRFQALYMYHLLSQIPSSDLRAVNFVEFEPSPLKTPFYEHWWIYSPTYFYLLESSDQPAIETAIILTGSMDKYCHYIQYIERLLSQCHQIIIWGGFTRSHQPLHLFIKGLEFLHAPNVHYYARSERDLMLYKQIGGTQGTLAGDPLAPLALLTPCSLHINNDILSPMNQRRRHEWQGRILFILSQYAWKKHSHVVKHLQSYIQECNGDIIGMDTYTDQNITPECIAEIEVFLTRLQQAKLVLTTRLHGAILAAMLHIPTLLIDISNDLDGLGTFKFKAIGLHACGFQQGLTATIDMKDVEILMKIGQWDSYLEQVIANHEKLYIENESKYMSMSLQSYQRLLASFSTRSLFSSVSSTPC